MYWFGAEDVERRIKQMVQRGFTCNGLSSSEIPISLGITLSNFRESHQWNQNRSSYLRPQQSRHCVPQSGKCSKSKHLLGKTSIQKQSFWYLFWLWQELIGALLSCSFFCLFPVDNRGLNHLPIINFDKLFGYTFSNKFHVQVQDLRSCVIYLLQKSNQHGTKRASREQDKVHNSLLPEAIFMYPSWIRLIRKKESLFRARSFTRWMLLEKIYCQTLPCWGS